MVRLPDDWEQLPMVIEGADLYVVSGEARLPRATYISCRIFIIGGSRGADALELRSQYYDCWVQGNSPYSPLNPAPPRGAVVGERTGQILRLVRNKGDEHEKDVLQTGTPVRHDDG